MSERVLRLFFVEQFWCSHLWQLQVGNGLVNHPSGSVGQGLPGTRGGCLLPVRGAGSFAGGVTFRKLVACGGPSLNSWHSLGGGHIMEIPMFHGRSDIWKVSNAFPAISEAQISPISSPSPSQRMLVRLSSVPMTQSSRRCTSCRLIVWNGAQKNSEGWADAIAKIQEAWTLSKRNSGPGSSAWWCFSISSFPTRIYSLLCSDQWMRISEFKDRYEGLISQSTALKREDIFSSCREREGWGSFLSRVVLLWGGRVKKPQNALGGLL